MSPSKRPKATAEEVEREASRYILHELGNRLWAGTPIYDEHNEQWAVAIHSRSLSTAVELGHITLDAHGGVVRAPSRRTLQRAVQRHQAPAPAAAPVPPFAFALARESGEPEPSPLVLPELPADPQVLGQELLADQDLQMAYRHLKLALADPHMRPTVLAALEAFARAARPRP